MRYFLLLIFLIITSCVSDIRKFQNLFFRDYINKYNFYNYNLKMYPYEIRIYYFSNYIEDYVEKSTNWWIDAIVYQVYIRSFYDSNGDGFGDINGLIEKLDYITNLGFNAIWMLPIFDSFYDGSIGRALGYEPIDYYNIHQHYGTMEDFRNLVKNCKERNIKIILDLMLNHTSLSNKWFINSMDNDSFYKDWYIWTNASFDELRRAKWQLPWGGGNVYNVWHLCKNNNLLYYGTWGAELNFFNTNVRLEAINIANYWIDKGSDGFRLDAIRYLIEEGPYPLQADTKSTFLYLKEFVSNLRIKNDNILTVGEVWTTDAIASKYYIEGDGLSQVFSFDFYYALKDCLKSESAISLKGYLHSRPKKIPLHFFSYFIDNHDVPRYFSEIRYNEKKAKLAFAILLTMPGTPYVYYGSEIGLLERYSPMAWNEDKYGGFSQNKPWTKLVKYGNYNVESQINDNNSLLNYCKKFINFRKNNNILKRGNIKIVKNNKKEILSYLRTGNDGNYLIIANFSDKVIDVELNFTNSGLDDEKEYKLNLLEVINK